MVPRFFLQSHQSPDISEQTFDWLTFVDNENTEDMEVVCRGIYREGGPDGIGRQELVKHYC